MKVSWGFFITHLIGVFVLVYGGHYVGFFSYEDVDELGRAGIIGATWYQMSIWFKSLFYGIDE